MAGPALGHVLVTGGGKRLGACIARACAAAGWRVVIHYGRSADDAQALAGELGGAVVQGDLSDPSQAAALFARARAAAGGPIAALVNSASAFEFDRPEAIDADLAARLHATNAVTPAMLASALAAQDDVAEGAVVNLLDQKLANPNPDFFSYSLSKYALAGATTMLAQALSPRVRVNAVAPGITLPSGGAERGGLRRGRIRQSAAPSGGGGQCRGGGRVSARRAQRHRPDAVRRRWPAVRAQRARRDVRG